MLADSRRPRAKAVMPFLSRSQPSAIRIQDADLGKPFPVLPPIVLLGLSSANNPARDQAHILRHDPLLGFVRTAPSTTITMTPGAALD